MQNYYQQNIARQLAVVSQSHPFSVIVSVFDCSSGCALIGIRTNQDLSRRQVA
jgi:ABC-type cobalamin/Fe3+-siderophores transport system ATPase subunit